MVVDLTNRTIDHYPPLLQRIKLFLLRHFQCIGSNSFLNGCGQGCFLTGLISIAGYGVCVAIPLLYSNDEYMGTFMKAFGIFLAFQIAMNWILLRTVDSTYFPSSHGTKPDTIDAGENVSEARHKLQYQNGNALLNPVHSVHRRDASSTPSQSVIYIATEYPKEGNAHPTRTAFPYFSWTPCLRCNRLRPPRCHHCPSCNKCVLKRDHHCFVTGVCVGYFNLRFFTVFLTWASVATVFASIHAVSYLYYEFWQIDIRYYDLFFLAAILRWLLGYVDFQYAFLSFILWLLLAFLIWSISFLIQVYKIVRTGLTSFELDLNLMMYDTRPLSGKLEAVFGPLWWVNFIVPLHFVFPPVDDPVYWPHMRA